MLTRRLWSLIPVLLLLPAFHLSAQERGVVPEDTYELVSVGGVALSPTGEHLAFTVTRVREEENDRRTTIWMQELEDGEPVGEPYRFTSPEHQSSSPRWSPDGRLLSFSSQRGDEEGSTWFLPVDRPGEAYQIDGIDSTPLWSPDGEWVAFTRSPEEGDDEEEDGKGAEPGWVAPDAVTEGADPERFDGRVITHMNYRSDGTPGLLPHPSIHDKSQLFVVPAEGGEPEQLTDLEFNVGQVEWHAEGDLVFFTGDEHEDEELREEQSRAIYVLDRDGGDPRRISPEDGQHGAPTVSPDGERLAFTFSDGSRGALRELKVVEIGPDGSWAGEPRSLTADWDLPPGSPTWTPDGDALRFTTGIRGATHVFEIPADGGEIRQVTDGPRRLSSVSYGSDGGLMAYTSRDDHTPAEVHLSDFQGDTERRVTSFNDEWRSQVARQPAEQILWRVSDGTEIEGWVIPPVDYDPEETYPMVMSIHGGPHSAYGYTFSQSFHVLSGAGFFVFYPNPRGSTTYGHDFTYATRGDWGFMDEEDFLTGVDAVLEEYPAIDEDRLGVMGGSYGGFSTQWLTARSDRFAAALARAGISQWESWWGTADVPGLTEFEFHGTPWENRELYRDLSPFSYVQDVETPTLVVVGEYDYRTPVGESEMWYTALKKQGVPTEFVVYPRSAHGIREPWLSVDNMARTRSWFEHWLVEEPTGTVDDASSEAGGGR